MLFSPYNAARVFYSLGNAFYSLCNVVCKGVCVYVRRLGVGTVCADRQCAQTGSVRRQMLATEMLATEMLATEMLASAMLERRCLQLICGKLGGAVVQLREQVMRMKTLLHKPQAFFPLRPPPRHSCFPRSRSCFPRSRAPLSVLTQLPPVSYPQSKPQSPPVYTLNPNPTPKTVKRMR